MVTDEVQGVGKMLPDSHTANAFRGGNLVVAASVGKAKSEDALLLWRKVSGDKLVDVRQPFVTPFCGILLHSHPFHPSPQFFMAQPLQALVADTRQQVALFRASLQHRLPTKQVGKDVADHILALLFVVEEGARHPQHLGIVLLKQPLNFHLFHHVVYCNTLQTRKMLTPKEKNDNFAIL